MNTSAERTQNHQEESDNHIVPSDPILISLIKSIYLPLLLTVTLGKQEATILYSAKKYFLCISHSFYLFLYNAKYHHSILHYRALYI